ncbi:MAG: hypothetical protein K9M54_12845 [Kiritimatiellales bacterium]|nr:hypothetical protein [Kiritimatiellales bacterium]
MKKNNPKDLMKDPFYAAIMFRIESHIHARDVEAQNESKLELTDSNIKSSIRKALGFLQGGKPNLDPGNPRDQWIGRIAMELAWTDETFAKENVSRQDYVFALLAVESSLKTRREMAGHSRGYLDFLKRFIEDRRID